MKQPDAAPATKKTSSCSILPPELLKYAFGFLGAACCLFGFAAGTALAAERLETSNTTANNTSGSSHLIYIAAPDRTGLYVDPNDWLTGITLKFKNNNGHSCNDIKASFQVLTVSDETYNSDDSALFNTTSGGEHEVHMDYSDSPILLSQIKQITTINPECWGHLSVENNTTNVWGADAGTYYGTAPADPWIKIYGQPGWSWTVDAPDGLQTSDAGLHLIAHSNTLAYGPGYLDFYVEADIERDTDGEGSWTDAASGKWRWVLADPQLYDNEYGDTYALDRILPLTLPSGGYRVRVRTVPDGEEEQAWSPYVEFTVPGLIPGADNGSGLEWSTTPDLPAFYLPPAAAPGCSAIGSFTFGDKETWYLPAWTWETGDGLPCLIDWLKWLVVPTENTAAYIGGLLDTVKTTPPLAYLYGPQIAFTQGLADGTPDCPVEAVKWGGTNDTLIDLCAAPASSLLNSAKVGAAIVALAAGGAVTFMGFLLTLVF